MDATLSIRKLEGYGVLATDGEIGRVSEFYFDDDTWKVRHVVADVRGWLRHRKVLIDPKVLGYPDETRRVIPAFLNRAQVKHSLDISADRPIALQERARRAEHYGWHVYLGGEALMGSRDGTLFLPVAPANRSGKPFDPHLRTTRVVAGHRLKSPDGEWGTVEDFEVDVGDWTIRELSALSDGGDRIAVPVEAVERISFPEKTVYCRLPRSQVRRLTAVHQAD